MPPGKGERLLGLKTAGFEGGGALKKGCGGKRGERKEKLSEEKLAKPTKIL